ncbi:MAG: (Fe-S)-binding protein [Deltaproteobacteria bacterium CG11_big_fil_rev_8_21_14_0_20_45_16]|nr:MAG: (Fe-S)-binding protein [Deltaproteobacteria bacterium CG11_big_fil_rev_8_21_14_0_20_45_16]
MKPNLSNRPSSDSQPDIEKTGAHYSKKKLVEVREKTWAAIARIHDRIEIGMTEDEAKSIAGKILRDMGSPKNWHKINLRMAENTALNFSEPSKPNTRLVESDIYYIDIGPVWDDHEGDAGQSFVAGTNERLERLVQDSKIVFGLMAESWRAQKLTGPALYAFGAEEASKRGWKLLDKMQGHRLSDFPHAVFSKAGLLEINFCPTAYAWVLEVLLHDPQTQRAAFFEDILF